MPIYVYEVILPSGDGGEQFEWLQPMSDPPLTQHPATGDPVRRVVTAAVIAGKWTDLKARSTLSDKNLAAKGLTKYVKTDKGKYEKTTGKGPPRISSD